MATQSPEAPEASAAQVSGDGPHVMDKGLKKNAIGYVSNVVIGVASTAPAYSLATTLGAVVAVVGVTNHAPAVLLVAFIPMFLVSIAYKYLNRADPDAGTSFAWTTRALGPGMGWMNGWAIFLADVVVMASLSQIAATYTFKLFGWSWAENHHYMTVIAAVLWIALMTWICYRGIELSAKLQTALLAVEVGILAIFAIVVFVKVAGHVPVAHAMVTEEESGKEVLHTYHAIHPSLDWLNPFAMSFGNLFVAMLIGFFIFWGWDSGVAVNEESENPAEGPGKAAVLSTVLLLLIYVVVSSAAQSFHGTQFLIDNKEDVLNALGNGVLGSTLNKLLIITVLTSASASTQTTILPTARTTLSMAHWKAVTALLSRVHKRFLTPTVSTLGFGLLSIAVTIAILELSSNVLESSITAVGFPICFYYGFTGVACAIYFRRELKESLRRFLLVGLLPLLGGLGMFAVGVKAAIYYGHKENGGKLYAGITLPLWIGIGGLVLGFILMIASRPVFKQYFSRKFETAPPGLLDQPPPQAIPAAVDF
jgi:amino acid transporter